MEEVFFDVPLYIEFAQLDPTGLPAECTILRFCHRLEKHKLANEIPASVIDC
jgi:transposase, IS5 family